MVCEATFWNSPIIGSFVIGNVTEQAAELTVKFVIDCHTPFFSLYGAMLDDCIEQGYFMVTIVDRFADEVRVMFTASSLLNPDGADSVELVMFTIVIFEDNVPLVVEITVSTIPRPYTFTLVGEMLDTLIVELNDVFDGVVTGMVVV